MNARFLKANKIVQRGTQMKHTLQRLVMGVVVTVSTVAPVAPASAHDTPLALLSGRGNGKIWNNHTSLDACDTEADNLRVESHYTTNTGATGYVRDANGSRDGCGVGGTTGGQWIVKYHVCAISRTGPVECTTEAFH
jgi:hypothetical protein